MNYAHSVCGMAGKCVSARKITTHWRRHTHTHTKVGFVLIGTFWENLRAAWWQPPECRYTVWIIRWCPHRVSRYPTKCPFKPQEQTHTHTHTHTLSSVASLHICACQLRQTASDAPLTVSPRSPSTKPLMSHWCGWATPPVLSAPAVW